MNEETRKQLKKLSREVIKIGNTLNDNGIYEIGQAITKRRANQNDDI